MDPSQELTSSSSSKPRDLVPTILWSASQELTSKFKPFKTSASLVLTLGKIQLKLETPHRSRVEHMVKIKPEVKFHVYR